MTLTDPKSIAHSIRDALPEAGLFAGQSWRIGTEPFPLEPKFVRELDSLGRVLLQFYRNLNLLYRKSAAGKLPPWIAGYLDQGKPSDLVELQRSQSFRNETPRVIRPDILLTDEGYVISELDSIPGGIGLTAWLNQTYAAFNSAKASDGIIGGRDGMQTGFAGIFGDAQKVHIVVSEESATYRPEMEWLAGELGESRFSVRNPSYDSFSKNDGVYRFFELFDLANVANARTIFELASDAKIHLTPPPKYILEEKLNFALLWNRNLREYWRQELGGGFLKRLLGHIPYTWIVDPSPLPPHAGIPELPIANWHQLKTVSQRDRDLILKVSGFSEHAWGARGVYLGSDLSSADWSAAIDRALSSFTNSPWILQRYHKPKIVESAWYDFDHDTPRTSKGRVRLCPYYFVHGDGDAARTTLAGVMATICPADKKIIHGMSEAIIVPCAGGGARDEGLG